MLFAHVAPRNGLGHERGSKEVLTGLANLGSHGMILKAMESQLYAVFKKR